MNLRTTLTITAATALGLAAAPTQADVLIDESFDYGSSDITLNAVNATGWQTASSTLLIYDADAGLDVAQMSGEAGGALGMPSAQTGQTAATTFTSYAMSNLSAGDTLWMASLVNYAAGTADHKAQVLGGSVTEIGFSITSAGTLQLYGSDNGGGNGFHDTTETGITSGTYLVLIRATKGTGTSPVDSTIDMWFNPADVNTLGTATFSTGADSKFGRNSQSLSSASVGLGVGGAIDEIRLATSFAELNLVPEPSSLALLGLGGLLVARRRRG